jgi:hypothetical protein
LFGGAAAGISEDGWCWQRRGEWRMVMVCTADAGDGRWFADAR